MTHPLYNKTGLQKNNKSHVMYALANKQMELKQLENEYEAKISKIKTDLTALETTICLFDENCNETISKLNTISSKSTPRKRNRYFVKGECKKLILTALRTTTTPLKTSQISLKVQDLKNISKNDISVNKDIQKICIVTLRTLTENNLVEEIGKDGTSILWSIKKLRFTYK